MENVFYLDRKNKKETFKAQIYYVFVSIYEGMVFSFLTLFLNESRKNLSWSPLMSSFSLFLPPLFAAIGLFICSFLVSSQKNNLRIMRILSLLSFVSLVLLSSLGLILPNGLNELGEIDNNSSYYLLYFIFLILPSLLMGFHWSFLSFHTSNIADINYAEKSKYGHVCLYGSLVPIIASPLSGLIAESIFPSYKGYLFLFLVSSPILIILFSLTFIFKPYPSNVFHDDDHEKVYLRDLFKNKTYILYLLLACLWIPLIWVSDSLTSNFWTSLESSSSHLNEFNPLTWGLFIGSASITEFIVIFITTKFGVGKKVKHSMQVSFIALFIQCLVLSIVSYFYNVPLEDALFIVSLLIFIHLGKGIANGLYLTSNILMLHYIVGPKLRRRAVFIAPFVYQLINSILQLIYPYLSSYRYISFAFIAFIAFVGLIISFFLDVDLLHKRK